MTIKSNSLFTTGLLCLRLRAIALALRLLEAARYRACASPYALQLFELSGVYSFFLCTG
jgi:hypothetical protein